MSDKGPQPPLTDASSESESRRREEQKRFEDLAFDYSKEVLNVSLSISKVVIGISLSLLAFSAVVHGQLDMLPETRFVIAIWTTGMLAVVAHMLSMRKVLHWFNIATSYFRGRSGDPERQYFHRLRGMTDGLLAMPDSHEYDPQILRGLLTEFNHQLEKLPESDYTEEDLNAAKSCAFWLNATGCVLFLTSAVILLVSAA